MSILRRSQELKSVLLQILLKNLKEMILPLFCIQFHIFLFNTSNLKLTIHTSNLYRENAWNMCKITVK